MGGKRAEAQARIDAAKRAEAEKKAAAEAAQKAEAAAHLFRGENEILLDEICSDLRRGLPFGLEKLMKHHMQGKVDVQAKDEFGCYLLMAAAQGGMASAVRDLLARGAHINADDDLGNTALHYAVLFEHPDVSALLLEMGADPEHRNHHGARPGELLHEHLYARAFAAVKSIDVTAVLNLVGRNFVPADLKEDHFHLASVQLVPRRFRERCSADGTFFFVLEEERAADAVSEPRRKDIFDGFALRSAAQDALEEATGPADGGGLDEEVDSMSVDVGCKAAGTGLSEGHLEDASGQNPGRTLLMYAAELGHMKLVKTLYIAARDRTKLILMQASNGDTAIEMAIKKKNFDIARYLNDRLPESEQTEIMTEDTVELNELRKQFDAFCLLGSAALGAATAAAGGRASTMDFGEFLKYLTAVGLSGPGNPLNKDMASAVFQWQMDVSTASGELEWPNFKQCLHRIAHQLGWKEIQGVPLEDLQDDSTADGNHNGILKIPLTKVSRKALQREFEAMQRSLDLIGDRCRETTSCRYAAYGFGVTTGRHKLKQATYDIYSKLLRAPAVKMKMPQFSKSKELMKKEMLAKQFFNLIDTDRSGSLTRYELQKAMDDFGFTKDEQEQVFQMVDQDNSGSVTLSEFIAGLAEGQVSFAGRESKSNKKETFLEIGLKISKAVNQKQTPEKIIAISPGLFGMIFKIFCDFAMKERLYQFEKNSCLFSAPKTSALLEEQIKVKKQVQGINTRFSVVNPFDKRVLASSSELSLDQDASFGSPRSPNAGLNFTRSPSTASRILPMASPTASMVSGSRKGERSPINTSTGKHETKAKQGMSRFQDPQEKPPPGVWQYEDDEFEEEMDARSRLVDTLRPSTSKSGVRLGTPMQAGSQRAASAIGMVKSRFLNKKSPGATSQQVTVSPDGGLLSEHTRVTLIPHRLTMTHSGNLLVGGAETTDPQSTTTIAALATRKHRITQAGKNILNRLVFHSLSFGAGHCAAVTDTGLVYTWGQGRYGQLGHGDELDRIIPQPVRGIEAKVVTVSASFAHNAAVTVNGHLFTWGDGKKGKLGHNDDATRLLPCIVREFVDRGLHIIAAQAGGSHTLALSSYKQAYSFGSGANGRLGHGNDSDQWLPTLVSSLERYQVVSLAAGHAHSVALTDDGQILTWGSGKLGCSGHGSDSDEVLPRKVLLFSHSTIRPVSVAAGEVHTSVLRSDGSMVTLGRVTHGRFAEGACVGEMVAAMRHGIAISNVEDWHHFPS